MVLLGKMSTPNSWATECKHHRQHLKAVGVWSTMLTLFRSIRGSQCLTAKPWLPLFSGTYCLLADGLYYMGAHLGNGSTCLHIKNYIKHYCNISKIRIPIGARCGKLNWMEKIYLIWVGVLEYIIGNKETTKAIGTRTCVSYKHIQTYTLTCFCKCVNFDLEKRMPTMCSLKSLLRSWGSAEARGPLHTSRPSIPWPAPSAVLMSRPKTCRVCKFYFLLCIVKVTT